MQAIAIPYRLRNPNREARLTSGEKRAIKLGVLVEKVSRKKLYRMYNGKCGICNERVRENRFEIDHRIPLSKGGEHSYDNCSPSHPVCNRLKADRYPFTIDDLNRARGGKRSLQKKRRPRNKRYASQTFGSVAGG
jgi:5-methylcytosine-specific restriction endonuclease McrA